MFLVAKLQRRLRFINKNFLKYIYEKLKNGTSPMCDCDWVLKKLDSIINFPHPIVYKYAGNYYLFQEEILEIEFLKDILKVNDNFPPHVLRSMAIECGVEVIRLSPEYQK